MRNSRQREDLFGSKRRCSGSTATFLAGTALAVLITAAGSARAEEVALRYTLDPGGPPISTRGQELLASDQPIQAVKLPRFHSKKPLYLTAKLGEGPDPNFTFALDESELGAGYDLLYVD